MAESGYSILWAVVAESIVIFLAIAFKHDKRIVAAVLIIGSLLAGIIGFGLSMYRREDASSLPNESLPTGPFPNGSFPNSELTDSISPTQIVEKLDTIHTYKARGTVNGHNGMGKVFIGQIEIEYIKPDKLHSIDTYEGNEVQNTIVVGDQYCMRHGQQDAWSCGAGSATGETQAWILIIKGQASLGMTVIDRGIRVYTWHDKKCHLYYKTEVSSDDLTRFAQGQSTVGVCIDPDTLLPVEYFAGGAQAVREEFDVFDINKPIDISLPVQ